MSNFNMLKGMRIFRIHIKTFFKKDCFVRSKHSSEGLLRQPFDQTKSKGYHESKITTYPATQQLPLPLNIEDIASFKNLKFSSQRSRDISGSFISSSVSSTSQLKSAESPSFSSSTESKKEMNYLVDERLECYDCSGVVNLSSVMQTNVPSPYVSTGEPIHLNLLGGHWSQKDRYMSEDLSKVHHYNTKNIQNGNAYSLEFKKGSKHFYMCSLNYNFDSCDKHLLKLSAFKTNFRQYCTAKTKSEVEETTPSQKIVEGDTPKLTGRQKLKATIRDYGSVVLVFHVGMSLCSLGCCYALVSSGVDLSYVIEKFGLDEGAATAGTAAHFIIAYGIHKSLMPLRIGITVTAVPFVVKKLRKMGILKAPKPKPL